MLRLDATVLSKEKNLDFLWVLQKKIHVFLLTDPGLVSDHTLTSVFYRKNKLLFLYGKWTEFMRCTDHGSFEEYFRDHSDKFRRGDDKDSTPAHTPKKVLAKLNSLKMGVSFSKSQAAPTDVSLGSYTGLGSVWRCLLISRIGSCWVSRFPIVSRGGGGASPPTLPLLQKLSFMFGWYCHWHSSYCTRLKPTISGGFVPPQSRYKSTNCVFRVKLKRTGIEQMIGLKAPLLKSKDNRLKMFRWKAWIPQPRLREWFRMRNKGVAMQLTIDHAQYLGG